MVAHRSHGGDIWRVCGASTGPIRAAICPRGGRYLPAAPGPDERQLEPRKAGDNCGQGHVIARGCLAVTRGRRTPSSGNGPSPPLTVVLY